MLGTARAAKHQFLVDLGVDEVIDYTSEASSRTASATSMSCSTSSAASPGSARSRAARGGLFIIVSLVRRADKLQELAADRIHVTGILVEPDRAGMEALADLARPARSIPTIADVPARAKRPVRTRLGRPAAPQGKLVLTSG